jgi:parvulin-like peptidyl-prolyl isomerase
LELASAREIANAFGSELAEAVAAAGQGAWSGPHRSAFGFHLILVSASEPGGVPDLAEIRSVVDREWSNERRQEANDRFYQALRDRYSVEIHLPADGGDNGLAGPAR